MNPSLLSDIELSLESTNAIVVYTLKYALAPTDMTVRYDVMTADVAVLYVVHTTTGNINVTCDTTKIIVKIVFLIV